MKIYKNKLWNLYLKYENGSSNIYKIAKNAINNIDRPSYLCRETNGDIKSPSLGLSVSRLSRETKDETSNQSASTSAYNQTILRV